MDEVKNAPAIPESNQALPGPHPHEAKDFQEWRGIGSTGQATNGLPAGVEPYKAPEADQGEDQELV